MKKNEGKIDRIIRAGAGVALIGTGFAMGITKPRGILLIGTGTALCVTAATGFCTIYHLLGLSTCPVGSVESAPQT
jgi:hypothetical protein